jgi:hypothetical protein
VTKTLLQHIEIQAAVLERQADVIRELEYKIDEAIVSLNKNYSAES